MSARLESPEEASARLGAERLSAEERAALWRRIDAGVGPAQVRHARRRALAFGVPALAAAAVCMLVWLNQRGVNDGQPQPHPQRPVQANECTLDASAARIALSAQCGERSVRVDGDEWSLAPGADVMRAADGVRVVHGRVRFHVRPRAPDAQFRVHVSHGEVRVVGTVFVIEQLAASGSITVTQGVIDFVWQDGTHERVAAGQTLHWPRAPSPPPEAPEAPATPEAPEAPSRRDATKNSGATPALDMDHTLDRLLQLQSQKRYADAVVLLRSTLQRPELTPLQRERISYELGLALGASGAADCAHWQQHVQRFGTEHHTAAVARRLAQCRP